MKTPHFFDVSDEVLFTDTWVKWHVPSVHSFIGLNRETQHTKEFITSTGVVSIEKTDYGERWYFNSEESMTKLIMEKF